MGTGYVFYAILMMLVCGGGVISLIMWGTFTDPSDIEDDWLHMPH